MQPPESSIMEESECARAQAHRHPRPRGTPFSLTMWRGGAQGSRHTVVRFTLASSSTGETGTS